LTKIEEAVSFIISYRLRPSSGKEILVNVVWRVLMGSIRPKLWHWSCLLGFS